MSRFPEYPFLDVLLDLLPSRTPNPARGVWISNCFMIVCARCARSKEFRKDQQDPALENDATFNCENSDCQRLIECERYYANLDTNQGEEEQEAELRAWVDNPPRWRDVRGEEAYRLADLMGMAWEFDEEITTRLDLIAEAILGTRGQRGAKP
jgi:hypothetical protein